MLAVTGPFVRGDHTGKNGTTYATHPVPGALGAAVLVADFEDGFAAPFAGLQENLAIVRQQLVVGIGNDFFHIAKGLAVAGLVILVHDGLGEEHVGHGFVHAADIGIVPVHREGIQGNGALKVGDELFVDFVGLELLAGEVTGEVHLIVRDVAPEFPEDVVVESAEYANLGLGKLFGVVGEVFGPADIGKDVVATLDAGVSIGPDTRHGLGGSGLEVHHHVPVVVVGTVGTAHPDLVGHDVGHNVERIVLPFAPVKPLERVVCGHNGFLQVLRSSEVGLQRTGAVVFHGQEFFGAGSGEGKQGCRSKKYILFHNHACF